MGWGWWLGNLLGWGVELGGLAWLGLAWIGVGRVGLAWVLVGLGWIGLGWAGLAWALPSAMEAFPWRFFQTDLIPGQQAGPGANGLVPVLEVVFAPVLGLGELCWVGRGWVGFGLVRRYTFVLARRRLAQVLEEKKVSTTGGE